MVESVDVDVVQHAEAAVGRRRNGRGDLGTLRSRIC